MKTNRKEGKEMSNKARKNFYKPNNMYQRNTGYYSGGRNYSFNHSYFNSHYINNGTMAGSSKYAFHSRKTRQYQHSRKDASEYYTDYHWQQPRRTRREPSPLNGSEEYTLRRIQETSDMIKRQLMSPDNTPVETNSKSECEPINKSSKVIKKSKKKGKETSIGQQRLHRKAALREKLKKSFSVQKSSNSTYDVKEIHKQIMNHISKLNYGRKQNLINADSTGYDAALQHIYKQKSLELSKALREMSHQDKPEASEIVNSIIPDFAIKFEELPIHIIRELSSTFDISENNTRNPDNIYSFDMNQPNPLLETNSFSQDYLDRSHGFERSSQSNSSALQSTIDDRVLYLNTEDADSLVIKEENLIESRIKIETMETIEIEDDDKNMTNHHEEIDEAYIADGLISSQSQSKESIPYTEITHTLSETAISDEKSPVIGTVRVSTSIFEKPNQVFSINNENVNESTKNFNENQTSCTSYDNLYNVAPNIFIAKNIFDKIGHYLSELDSSTQNIDTVNEPPSNDKGLCSDFLNNSNEHQSSIQETTYKTITFEEQSINTEINDLNMDKNVAPCSSVSIDSNLISSNSPQENESSVNQMDNAIGNQLVTPLVQNTNGESDEQRQRYYDNVSAPICDNEDISKDLNSPQLCEKSRSGTDPIQWNSGAQIQNKYVSVTIKSFQKPKDIAEAAKIMLEIDSQIEILTKLRQTLIVNLIGDQNSLDLRLESQSELRGNSKKRKKKKGGYFGARMTKKEKRIIRKNFNQNREVVLPPSSNNSPGFQLQEIFQEYNSISAEPLQTEDAQNTLQDFRKTVDHENLNQNVEIVRPSSANSNSGMQREWTLSENSKVSADTIQIEGDFEDRTEKQLMEENDFQQNETTQAQNTQNSLQDFRNIIDLDVDDLIGVPLICKVVEEDNSLIVGTDNGRIQYFNLSKREKPITVRINRTAITSLEWACIGEQRWVFFGTEVDAKLRVIEYKINTNTKVIPLEDCVQSMHKEWQYFFIGGNRGFLTRYNWQRGKIEYEDKISEMSIVNLKTSKEGPRKILIILFKDEFGTKEIHVRDAMSALHIRTIGEVQRVDSMLINGSSVYFSSNQEIAVYSFCDGQFISKCTVPGRRCFSTLHQIGNLLLAVSSDANIYAYNMKNMNLLGYFSCDLVSTLVIFHDKVIYGSWSSKLKSIRIPENILAASKKL